MKLLLVNPAQNRALDSEASPLPGKGTGAYPPLGLLYLQAAVEHNTDTQVEICDENFPGAWHSFDKKHGDFSPDLLGFTALTPNLPGVLGAIAFTKNKYPDAQVVVGGPHVDLFPTQTLNQKDVDFVACGEAEQTLSLLVNKLSSPPSPDPIACVFSKGDESISDDLSLPWIENIDDLPMPDRSRIVPAAYRGIAGEDQVFTTMISGRGCPYRCTFCSTPRSKYRLRDVGTIIDEMAHCASLGIGHVYFLDDTFPTKGARLDQLCNGLIERDTGLGWSCRTVAGDLTKNGLALMKKAGCTRIQVGVETCTEEGLAILNKPTSIKQIQNVFALANQTGIKTMAYFMLGLPNEQTPADVRKMFSFAKKLDPTYALFNVLTLYPGTTLFNEAVELNLVKADVWQRFAANPTSDFNAPVWEEFMSRQTLFKLQSKAYRSFYWRLKVIARALFSSGGLSGFIRRARVASGMLFSSKGGVDD